MSVKTKLVAAALIVNDGGAILLTRRGPTQAMAGFWEFPGGKLEEGESPIEALHREIKEELGCALVVGPVYDVLFHRYPQFDLLMVVYTCGLAPGEAPQALQVADMRWLPPASLGSVEILPADAPLTARLAREGAPAPPRPEVTPTQAPQSPRLP
ncbi:MAG: (deoxy)nucleoside triphosphate pyrophosphohydrolase [Deltaproteobacteria bacterium]|nr:(deoxy)nucleoside triphosphate pyrophosphohydrolase [Deltaproteobacteria bacterium]